MAIRKTQFKYILYLLLLLTSTASQLFWYKSYFHVIIVVLILLFSFDNFKNNNLVSNYILIFFIPVFYFLVDSLSTTTVFGFFITYSIFLTCFLLLIETDEFRSGCLDYITKGFAILLVISISFYILSFFISLPSFVINERYDCYPFFVSVTDTFSSFNYERYFFLFSEPGDLGVLCFFILLLNNIKFTKYNIIILIAGLMSLSLFFYVALIVLIAYKYIYVQKAVLPVIVLLMLIYYFTKDNEFMKSYLYNRLGIGEGIYESGRVTESFQNFYNNIVLQDKIFGVNNYFDFLEEGVCSYKVFVTQFGYFGILIYFYFLIKVLSLKIQFKYIILFCLSTAMFLYDREYIISFYFMMFIGLFSVNFKKNYNNA